MSSWAPVVALLLFVGVVWYLVAPLFDAEPPFTAEDEDRESLHLRKRALYKQIKELEMDYEIGNLSAEDFQSARQDLKKEVAEIMTKEKGNRRT